MRAFGVAAGWLEEGTPEARELGAEIFALLDVLDEEEITEVAEALATGDWVERW
ncbi:hypothetical protein [Streptomyces sp. HUAS TT20]|uniref:hypothetical protein n=1 Tax=Streptomyces sp. HUAS TT20 TaxID=3447509 RepID=UPI0021D8F8D9|nr:hypothetical protein [Streptomyces sp. HUAS 15-9]UXY28572.1 hypothetical protein N8I87_19740 [Streptomyces sp. HUAS 15-9]